MGTRDPVKDFRCSRWPELGWAGALGLCLVALAQLVSTGVATQPEALGHDGSQSEERLKGLADPLLVDDPPPVPREAIPVLQMPFAAGAVVLCSQGNYATSGRTHSFPQNLHALDFSSRTQPVVTVVAAAAGSVHYVVRDVGEDPEGGAGYGNQVRVAHGQGVFTLYSHLERVTVEPGDTVVAGQPLGTMGRSGLAGDRHLHFSLHYGAIDDEGVPPTIEIPELVTLEPATMTRLRTFASGELRCSPTGYPWAGALYGSDNRLGREPSLERPDASLAAEIEASYSSLERSRRRRDALWRFAAETPRTTPDAARRSLESWLAEAPDDPVVQYAWAVEVDMPERSWRDAETRLYRAEQLARLSHLFEPWILPWIENQRGAIAAHHGRWSDARRHFREAFRLLPLPELRAFSAHHLLAAPSFWAPL